MNKFGIIVGIITLLIIGGGIYLVTKPKAPVELPQYDSSKHVYFWGNGCPHCAAVDEFVNSWENKDKLEQEVQKFEVWYNSSNQALMTKLATEVCKITPQGMGVPLLVAPDGKCYNGDGPVIEYYKTLKFD